MASVASPEGYGATVRATVVWAVATALGAVALTLPFVVGGLALLAQGVKTPVSVGEAAVGLVLAALGGWGLYGAARCAALSAVRVWKSPGYPERHWWFVRRAFRWLLWTELVFTAVVAGLTTFAVFGNGRLAEGAVPVATVAWAVFVLYQAMTVVGMNDVLRHAKVVPYFPRKVGEIATYSEGKSLARHVAELDAVAGRLGLTPLSAFGWNDDFVEGEPLVWHDAAEGLKTVDTLLAVLQDDDFAWDDHAAAVADLKRLAHALARAEAQGIPFSLLLLHSTATNGQEWEIRRGTCF